MNSKKSTLLQNEIELPTDSFSKIKMFVGKYDGLYKDLAILENDIQSLLKRQETIVNELEKTRSDEENFFTDLSIKTKKDVSYLKHLASTWVIENKKQKLF